MKRPRLKVHRDGWATAMAPRLVDGAQQPEQVVSPSQKRREAEEMRAQVEAHLRAGGRIEVLPATPARKRGRHA